MCLLCKFPLVGRILWKAFHINICTILGTFKFHTILHSSAELPIEEHDPFSISSRVFAKWKALWATKFPFLVQAHSSLYSIRAGQTTILQMKKGDNGHRHRGSSRLLSSTMIGFIWRVASSLITLFFYGPRWIYAECLSSKKRNKDFATSYIYKRVPSLYFCSHPFCWL